MFILVRYVVREVLQAFLVTLTVTTLLMTVVGAMKEGMRLGLPPLVVLRLVPYVLTEMLRFTIPGSLLFAVCLAFGRMSAGNELTALKAVGVSPLKIILPVYALATLLSVNTAGLYEASAVWCRPGMAAAVADSAVDIIYASLRTQRTLSTPQMEISVRRTDGRKLIGVCASLKRAEDGRQVTLTAEEAEIRRTPGSDLLILSCRNGYLEMDDRGTLRTSEEFEVKIDVGESQREDRVRISSLSKHDLPPETERCSERVAQLEHDLEQTTNVETAAAANYELLGLKSRLAQLRVEPHRRWACGFTCLCFVLIGVPAGTLSRHGDTLSLFFVCFLPIMVLYYPLLIVGESFAKSGRIPATGVWLADGLLAAAGGYLLYRSLRR
jgi:lipopolysaccharide export system permease protein